MSNINPQNIDGTFPIAGQDNNSQGFRDNFTNTINNFTFAAAELTDLQTYAVLTAPLSSVGQTSTPTNNMNYTYLTKPQLKASVETVNALGSITPSGSFSVDWSVAHFQTVTLTTAATMSFASTWPTTNLWTKLRLQVTTTNTTTLTLPATVTVNISNIRGYTSGTSLSLAAGTYVFEFSTADNGSTVTIEDVLRNYDAAIDFTNLSVTGNVIGGLAQFASINSTPIGNASPSTGTFTALASTGNLSFNGTLVETGYQQVKPGANVAVTVNSNVNRLLLHPASSIISFGANVTLPNTQVDGTIISISSNVTIAQLAVVTPWVGTTVSPYGNVGPVSPGTVSRFMFINADKTWYKIA